MTMLIFVNFFILLFWGQAIWKQIIKHSFLVLWTTPRGEHRNFWRCSGKVESFPIQHKWWLFQSRWTCWRWWAPCWSTTQCSSTSPRAKSSSQLFSSSSSSFPVHRFEWLAIKEIWILNITMTRRSFTRFASLSYLERRATTCLESSSEAAPQTIPLFINCSLHNIRWRWWQWL